jgi:hypothetical protein
MQHIREQQVYKLEQEIYMHQTKLYELTKQICLFCESI